MSFKKNKYVVIKQAIDKDLALFLYNYFSVKKQVYDTCIEKRYISKFETMLGGYELKDGQVPNSYHAYSDIAMDTLLLKCQPEMEKATGLKLYPAYTYARIYKKGDKLKRHKDRFSCEISATMNLGGDEWPIYLELDEKIGVQKKDVYYPGNKKGEKIILKPGDMLVYRGCDLEHWREKFKSKECVQVFLHYNNQKTPGAKKNIFDNKPHIGLPNWFQNR